MSERIDLAVADGLAHLRLIRADAHNAIDPLMVDELAAAVAAIAELRTVRAVLITADGASFTVGGELDHMLANAARLPDEMERMIDPYHAALDTLGQLPVPIVAAAQGSAAGGGLGLLWVADIVLVAEDVKIAAGFPLLGLSGDGGSSWAVTQLAGVRRAQQFLLGGRVLGAQEALEWGLASHIVSTEELEERALEEARRLAAGPTVAFGQIRQLIRSAGSRTWAEHLVAERSAMKRCGATTDVGEGLTAFSQRRRPNFTGR